METQLKNLEFNLERAETYEEYMEILRMLSIEEHKQECGYNMKKLGHNTKGRFRLETHRRKIDEKTEILMTRFKEKSVITPEMKTIPFGLSDNRYDEHGYYSIGLSWRRTK
jgi:hypothetical protein